MILIRCFTAEKTKKGLCPLGWEPMWIPNAETEEQAVAEAHKIIERFNAFEKAGKRPERVIRYWETLTLEEAFPLVKEGLVHQPKHDWRKTNLVTTRKGTDEARCECCGALGVRYGLGDFRTTEKSLKQHPYGCYPESYAKR